VLSGNDEVLAVKAAELYYDDAKTQDDIGAHQCGHNRPSARA